MRIVERSRGRIVRVRLDRHEEVIRVWVQDLIASRMGPQEAIDYVYDRLHGHRAAVFGLNLMTENAFWMWLRDTATPGRNSDQGPAGEPATRH